MGHASPLQIMVQPQPDTSWHFLLKTRNGTVSLVKGLTHKECKFMEDRAWGRPATDAERAKARADEEERDAGWAKWKADHKCKEPSIWDNGAFSGESYQDPQTGECIKGYEFGWVTSGPGVAPYDTISAECFQ